MGQVRPIFVVFFLDVLFLFFDVFLVFSPKVVFFWWCFGYFGGLLIVPWLLWLFFGCFLAVFWWFLVLFLFLFFLGVLFASLVGFWLVGFMMFIGLGAFTVDGANALYKKK